MNTPAVPTSCRGCALCSYMVRDGTPNNNIAKRLHLACWQAIINANWAVGGVCTGFTYLLFSSLVLDQKILTCTTQDLVGAY